MDDRHRHRQGPAINLRMWRKRSFDPGGHWQLLTLCAPRRGRRGHFGCALFTESKDPAQRPNTLRTNCCSLFWGVDAEPSWIGMPASPDLNENESSFGLSRTLMKN